jgi:TP53 regulating kinase-like protein
LLLEARALVKLYKEGVPVPCLLFVDNTTCSLFMEYVSPSISLKHFLISCKNIPEVLLNDLASQIGKNIALTHNAQYVHGDLTTSNMLLKPKINLASEALQDFSVEDYLTSPSILYLIDFGLCYGSNSAEDLAVDLHVLEKAIGSAHPDYPSFVSFK